MDKQDRRGFVESGLRAAAVSCLVSTLLAGCAGVASSTGLPSPSDVPAPDASTFALPSPTQTPLPTTGSSSSGGGPLLVYQLDGSNPGKATTETVFTLEIDTLQRRELGSLQVDADSCCPTFVQWTADRTRAFLYSSQLRGIVDVAAASIGRRPARVPLFGVAASPDGQRLAWVDAVTGAAESIVIADDAGSELARLALPDGAWATGNLVWSPDGRTILATTLIPLTTSTVEPAAFFCCSVDHGPSATHLVAIPVDGSTIQDLVDDAADVQSDLTAPPAPPDVLGLKGGTVERQVSVGRWSPDGRAVSVAETTCWTEQSSAFPRTAKRGCVVQLSVADLSTGSRRLLLDTAGSVIDAAWSPDGRTLLIASTHVDRPAGIDAIDVASGLRQHLADTGVTDLDRVMGWSPDGSWIVYDRLSGRASGDRIDVWVMRSDGQDQQLIARHAAAAW